MLVRLGEQLSPSGLSGPRLRLRHARDGLAGGELSLHRDGSGQRAEVVVAMDPAGRWEDCRRQEALRRDDPSRGGPGAHCSTVALALVTRWEIRNGVNAASCKIVLLEAFPLGRSEECVPGSLGTVVAFCPSSAVSS